MINNCKNCCRSTHVCTLGIISTIVFVLRHAFGVIECLSRLHDRQLVYGKCRKTCIKHLLIERAGQGVGHKRSVCHCVDVLYQVMKEVTVRARKQEKTGQKQITFEKPVKAKF